MEMEGAVVGLVADGSATAPHSLSLRRLFIWPDVSSSIVYIRASPNTNKTDSLEEVNFIGWLEGRSRTVLAKNKS
jgi:hypothetical protein